MASAAVPASTAGQLAATAGGGDDEDEVTQAVHMLLLTRSLWFELVQCGHRRCTLEGTVLSLCVRQRVSPEPQLLTQTP